MLIKQLIRETLELQGFRIESVEKKDSGILITIEPDLRYSRLCFVIWNYGCIFDFKILFCLVLHNRL